MAYREIDVQVVEVDSFGSRLVVKRRKMINRKVIYKILKLRLDAGTLVHSTDNESLSVAEIKKNARITVDYINTPQTGCLVKGITVLSGKR
ncbi:MAG: hypothetical protein AB7S78_10795 [Candidatus Omnitrophota bacterium]